MVSHPFRARVLAASVFVAVAAAPGAALACNPIQFLFGGCRPQPTPQPQPTLENLIDQGQGPVAKPKRKAASGPAPGARQVAIAPPQGADVGSVAHFSEDKTLRRGDVVVTPNGFLVYRGAGRTHSREDFEPLSRPRDELANLEKASRTPGVYAPALATVTASAEASRTLRPRPARADGRDFQAKAAQ